MVNRRFPLPVMFAVLILLVLAGKTQAQSAYRLDQEWTEIWVRPDGTIDLTYNISLTLDSGPDISRIFVGQPKRDFTIGQATDQHGHPLQTSDASSGNDYKVAVTLQTPLKAGETARFALTTNVAHMLFEDTPGCVGMQFTPTWWQDAEVLDLRILIVLPPNVSPASVNTTEVYWNNTLYKDERLAIYWEKQNLVLGERFDVGLSYPEQEGWSYEKQPAGWVALLQQWALPLSIIGVFAVAIGIALLVRKKPYLTPTVSMETLGTKRGLTAVEASYLLGMSPTKIVTEILYSLLQKRAIWIVATKPSLRLKALQSSQSHAGTADSALRYYEIDFLNAIRTDGSLDEEELAHTVMFLRETVGEKMRGYRRRETIEYYRKIVAKAWEQVEQAGTAELASNAYDEQLLWLLLDPNARSHTKAAFQNKAFEPSPFWLWYWYGYSHYHPKPTYKPNIENPAQSVKPPAIPGSDFANGFVSAVENTSNNIVANIEKFANAITPMPQAKSSAQPAHHSADCVCACAACACACACVSCACACAGGGVG